MYRKKTRELTAKKAKDTGTAHYRFHINFAVYGRVSIITPKKARELTAKKAKDTGTSHYRFHINSAINGKVYISWN